MLIGSLDFQSQDLLLLILHSSFKEERFFLLEYLLQVDSFKPTIFLISSFFIEDFLSI
jgi:hypothetical protein